MKTLLAAGFLLLACTTLAQTKKDTLSIAQSLSRYTFRTPVFSPDGSKAAVVVSQTGLGEQLPQSHIWMVDVASKTIRQFTNSAKSETSPQWSPDGKTLAFLSGRNGKTQILTMSMDGGEALPLTKSKTAITNFLYNSSGKSIAYLTEEPATEAEDKRKEDKYDEEVVSEADKPTRIFILDVNSKAAKQVSKQNWEVEEIKWMPNGDSLLLVTQSLPQTELPVYQLSIMSLKDSSVTNLPCPANSFWGGIEVSPDGSAVSYRSSLEDGPAAQDMFVLPFKTGAAKNITGKSLNLPVITVKYTGNHNILATVQKGFLPRLYTITDDGTVADYGINQNVGAFDVSTKGNIIFESFSGASLAEIWLAGADKKAVQISHFNNAFDSFKLAIPTYFTYKSFDATPVEGALYKPADAGAQKLPLVVLIHGGPTGAFTDNYSAWVQLFVQKGYAVFCPNVRGSTGYGWKFITANKNDWGGADFKDVMAGVDYLIAKENIDSNRMGISGWSYGGYMSMWAITQTHRFKAAMAGAGLSDLASEFGTENGAAYDHWFFGTPYEHFDNFYAHSPIKFVKNAVTPTLIIQGEEDDVDPKGQSQQLYRALRYYNVPTELVLYPREPHGFREIKHSIDFYTRMLAWFDKYVK